MTERSSIPTPTEKDWSLDALCMDGKHAHKMFFGLGREEASELFIGNSLYRQEDLANMPLACFKFYLHSFIDYLLSNHAKGDADGAAGFIDLTKRRQKEIHECPEMLSAVLNALNWIQPRQEWYDADLDIYNSFDRMTAAIIETLETKND